MEKLYDGKELTGYEIEQEQDVDEEIKYPILRAELNNSLRYIRTRKAAGID